MCRDLHTLKDALAAYARSFDANSLLPAQAAEIITLCARIRASIESLQALAAARCSEGESWKHEGCRSPAEQLARMTGTSTARARRTLETGKRMSTQPEVAQAALAGDLSPEQTEIVSDGVAANSTKAGELIDKARHGSLSELNEEVARVKALATDQEERRRHNHERRSFKRWTDRDGAWHGKLYGNPEDGVRLWRALDPIRRRLIMCRRGKQPNESLDALDFDALMAMADIAAGVDGELGLSDLLDLGLFPQFETAAASPGQYCPSPASHSGPQCSASTSPPADSAPPRRASSTSSPAMSCHPVGLAEGAQGELFAAVVPAGGETPLSDSVGPPAYPAPAYLAPYPPPAYPAPAYLAPYPPPAYPAPAYPAPYPPPAYPPPSAPGCYAAPSPAAPSTAPPSPPPAEPATSPPRGGPQPSAPTAERTLRRRTKKLAGSPAKVIVRVDLDTLLRGVPIEGEVCEIDGYGPVPVSVIEGLLATGNTFVAAVLTRGEKVLSVYHHRRRPNAHQKTALEFVYPTCAVLGCNARSGLQADHREDWAKTHFTVVDLMDQLCPHDHDLKTNHGWALVQGTGKRAFVPPSDPRHPRRLKRTEREVST